MWTFISWGIPFRLDTPHFTNSEGSAVVQVESGWIFCSALTDSGDVYVWWPFNYPIHGVYSTRRLDIFRNGTNVAQVLEDGSVSAAVWDLAHNPTKLPELPDLPELRHEANDTETKPHLKIVKIAAMDNVLIALTNRGHVLKFAGLMDAENLRASHWVYVSCVTFSKN